MKNSLKEFLDYNGLEVLVSKIKEENRRIEDKIDSSSGGKLPENLAYLDSEQEISILPDDNCIKESDVINSLISTQTDKPVSANQARILSEMIQETKNSIKNAKVINHTLKL